MTLWLLEELTKNVKDFKHQDLQGMPTLYKFDKVEENETEDQKW